MTAASLGPEAAKLVREALREAIMAMGKAGANADITHPQREAWDRCRGAYAVMLDYSK